MASEHRAQELSDLLARVEGATGPDRSIDRALAYYLDGTGVEKERKLYVELGDAMWAPGPDGLSPYDIARGDRIRHEWQKGSRGRRGHYAPVRWFSCDGPMPLTECEAFTASVDAAIALVERLLPGWRWSLGNLKRGGQAYLMRSQGAELIGPGIAPTPALAILAALLRALLHDARDGASQQKATDHG